MVMMTQEELKKYVAQVQTYFLTSNDIVSRTEYPHYYGAHSVPASLNAFKKRLENYRIQVVESVMRQSPLSLSNAMDYACNFSEKTSFAHQFCVALAVSQLGVGDCGECSSRLGMDLVRAGFGDLAFPTIQLTHVENGMEQYHALVVVNMPKSSLPDKIVCSSSIYDFFKALPKDALIADVFLGLVFSPSQVPKDFIDYINAYGGTASVISCPHWYDTPKKSALFEGYWSTAERVVTALKSPLKEFYPLTGKVKIEDTACISLLNRQKYKFFGVRDEEYKVDAVLKIASQKDQARAESIQRSLGGHGRFFKVLNGKDIQDIFVLEGVNLAENPKLIERLQMVF